MIWKMTEPESRRSPRWDVPYPYGHAGAIDSMGGVAAPLLAGFSVTFAALVLSTPDRFRWVSLTLLLLSAAAAFLIASLQFTFRARQFVVSPTEMAQWFPDANSPERLEELHHEQHEHRMAYKRWANRARDAYNGGIVCFASGFTVALVPPGVISNGRLVVIIAALLAVVAEFGWIAEDRSGSARRLRARRQMPR
jgi:hypothetical protein